MKPALFLLPLALVAGAAPAPVPQFNGATPLEWSQKLADSEMKRLGASLERGGSGPKKWMGRWDYTPGVLALSLVRLGEATGNKDYLAYGTRAVGSHVNADGTI